MTSRPRDLRREPLPRDLIREALPLDGLHPRFADRWVVACLDAYANDPDHRQLSAIITTRKIQLEELRKHNLAQVTPW
jgi:hypothetical protein